MKYYLLLSLVAVLALPGCKKTATPTPVTTDVKIDTDIYIAGNYSAKNGNQVAVYWKNGFITKLSDSLQNAFTNGIVVDGSDVFIVGNYYNSTRDFPVYWKNDHQGETLLRVPDTCTTAFTSGISVYNQTVYVSGEINKTRDYPVYWQGANTPVQLSQSFHSESRAIAADATGVYSAGYSRPLNKNLSTYWKNNGLPHTSTDTLSSRANAIALGGTDIYTAGNTTTITATSKATYWKNGIPVYLTDGSVNFYATVIAVKDNLVYTGGYRVASNGNAIACYWKGSALTELSNDTDNLNVLGMALAGNDVHIIAYNTVTHTSTYWKNGVLQVLPSGAVANRIVVVTHAH